MNHLTWATLADADPSATIRPGRDEPDAGPLPGPSVQLSFSATLGEGAMGVVRLATQPSLERTVAVKSLRGTTSPAAVQKLVREARVTGALQHPNIVPIYDILVDQDDHPHILMKRISGVEWETVVDQPATLAERFGVNDPLAWNLGILATLCNALRCAHDHGVLHRDLKPANVMIGEFGEVYLVDWGIACTLDDDRPGIAGTPRYMSPEMAEGRHAGVATDVYLLGGLLHRILAGRPPHRGDAIDEILATIPSFAPDLPPDTPSALVDLVRRSMARDPHDRPATADAFRLQLSAYLERRGSLAVCHRAARRLQALQTELASAPDRRTVYEHLSACRFGFQSSLETWPTNPEALAGLQQAVLAVVRFEIDQRDPTAARRLLDSLDQPVVPSLEDEVASLERARAAEEEEHRRLLRDADIHVGETTRLVMVSVFGSAWVLIAVGGHVWIGVPGHDAQIGIAAATLAATAAFCVWARESLSATAVNRMTAGLMLCSPTAQLLLATMMWLHDGDPVLNVALDNLLYGTLIAAGAFAMDVRALPSAGAFALAALGGVVAPGSTLLFTAGALAVFMANLWWLWRPTR